MLTLKSTVVVLIVMMSLGGCATALTSCPAPTQIAPDIQRKAAEEVADLPENSAIPVVLSAALDDRDKLRACRAIN